MKRISFFAGLMTIAAIAVAAAYSRSNDIPSGNRAVDGAFRDGTYLGRLAAERGETARVGWGRWATIADRESFCEGYVSSYEQTVTGETSEDPTTPKTDINFRDGLCAGELDAEQDRAVQTTSDAVGTYR